MSVANSVPSKIVMRGTSRMPLHERFGAAPTITIHDSGADEKKPGVIMGIPSRVTRMPRTNVGGMRADEYEESMARGGGLFQRAYTQQPTVQRMPLQPTRSSYDNRDLVRRMEQSLGIGGGGRGRGGGGYDDRLDLDEEEFYDDDDAMLMDYSRLYNNPRARWGRRDQSNVHQRLGDGYGGRITKRYQQPVMYSNINRSGGWSRGGRGGGGYVQSYGRAGAYNNGGRRQTWRHNMNPFRELEYFTQFTQQPYRQNRRGGGRWMHNAGDDEDGERRYPQRHRFNGYRRGRGGYRGGRGGGGKPRSNLVKVSSIMNMDEDTKKVYWEQQRELDKDLDAYTKKENVVDDPM